MPLHFCIISPARQGAIRIYPTAHTSTMSVIYHRTLLTVTKYHIFHRNESVDIKCIDSESIQRRSIYIICFRILFYNLLTNKVPSVTVKQCLIIGSTIYFNTFDSMAAAGFADRLDNAEYSLPLLPAVLIHEKGEDNDSCSADTYSASKDSMYG